MNAKTMMTTAVAALLATVVEAAASFLTVTNVTCRQRYPWNGKVDVDFEVRCDDAQTNVNLYVSAQDVEHAKSLAVKTVACADNVATNAGELAVRAGRHRLVWDFGADNPNVVSTNVVVSVQGLLGSGLYLVIDLSGGAGAASYPVSYLGAPPAGGWTDEYKTTKLVLRRILPGTFTMGSDSSEVGYTGYEAIPHEVTVTRPFYMGVFQVTQKQYALVTGNTPSCFKGDMRPVENVSWNTIRGNSSTYNWPNVRTVDAASFMGKLKAKTGLDGFDLPTEAQWEYACRAGTTTALNSGKNLTNVSQDSAMDEVGCYWYNYSVNKGGYTNGHKNVGSYSPNAWGLYDMHGNVWEWCLDWYQSRSGFSSTAVSGERGADGPASGSHRVLRGGCWIYYAQYCRSASRYYYYPSYYSGNYGFRLCLGSAGL